MKGRYSLPIRTTAKRFFFFLAVLASTLHGQTNKGGLRLEVRDPAGSPVDASVRLVCDANQYALSSRTNSTGVLTLERLPFGTYRLAVTQPAFAPLLRTLEIQSALTVSLPVTLEVATVLQTVRVDTSATLLDAHQAGASEQIGVASIENRLSSIPGRSLQDLVNSQPGWLYEGNAVLHPRGSEYQTQFVIDGVPLTDNRSPSFGPEIEADDMQSISIYTAGIPAEYGRKLGGVVELNTAQDVQPGLHGKVVLSGGSFDSAAAFAEGQLTSGKNTFGGSASGSTTDHYLNPVVPQNYSNTGSLADFSARYRRDLTRYDRLVLTLRHELSRYDLPNEQVQQAAGQRQTAQNEETIGIASYNHEFSAHTLAEFHGMVRDNANEVQSNPQSTPVAVSQHNSFREGYFRATAAISSSHQEWKFGTESDNTFLHENTSYAISDQTQFDDNTPPTFAFIAQRPDLEQSVFVQDLIRAGKWTANAGVRFDHYQLLLNQRAFDPRLAVSRYFASADLVLHFSYDRVFQPPSFENLLLSSSATVQSLAPQTFLRLPVQPSQGNYYEAGLAKTILQKVRLDANCFRRAVNNYADDSQIQNTTISFPIAFRKALIYGAEAKLEMPETDGLSGFISYSYEVGNAWNPVTGGLFLGEDATAAEARLTGHFPDSQDQRNTVRGRLRYQVNPMVWVAAGVQSDSGLPFDFNGDPSTVLAQYGQAVLSRINFTRGRILPTVQANASAGVQIYRTERLSMGLQADGQNLTDVLNVIDFGGLFSGNAIGPSRNIMLRFTTTF